MSVKQTGEQKTSGTGDHSSKQGSNTWIIVLVLVGFVGGIGYWAVSNRSSTPPEPGSVYVAAPENSPAARSGATSVPPNAAPTPAPAAGAPHDHSDPNHTHAEMAPPSADTIPSYFASAEAARPFPRTVPPGNFWNPVVVRAYAAAQEIPGVLAQQPCYCFCYRIGHRGLLDCFASEHGSVCSVCIQEALLADQMTKQGRSPSQIREAIIRGEWREIALN
jgi:hypothetical protein